MSLGWTLTGTIFELVLAYMLFMLVAFSGGGMVSGRSLTRRQTGLLDLSLFMLPGLCVLSACIVIGLHWCGGGAVSYAWYALPLLATVLYFAYLASLSRTP